MTITDTPSQAPVTTQSGFDFDAVLCTYEVVSWVLPEIPAWSYPLLNAKVGAEVTVKHENIQPIGTFKAYGGVALMAALSSEERRRGVVIASTGNHTQPLAWAGACSEVPVIIIVPVDTSAYKVAAVRVLGVRAVIEGEMMCESLVHAETLVLREGMRMVSPGDEPATVLEHATVYLELSRHHPNLRTVYAPVGSGFGAADACLVRDALTLGCRIIGIQSSVAPAAYRAWTSGESAIARSRTCVAGLAVGMSFILIQSVLGRSLNDFILVDDDAIQSAVSLLTTHVHTLAEGAGATNLAGLMVDPIRQGHCATVYTGGNANDHKSVDIFAGISTRAAVGTDATPNC